ncbi:MAG: hypothetical protein K2H74_04785, partial [Paramuribaculum sp.]|nr:hypothetical protein [Paramuribaculum sp.]
EGRIDSQLPIRVNVADIADSAVNYIPEMQDSNDGLALLEDEQDLLMRRLIVKFANDYFEDDFYCYALPGGVSKQNLRAYQREGEDCFSARFLNPRGNFFLTTRTAGWCIIMKETEISPLYFICGTPSDLSVRTLTGNTTFDMENLLRGIYALDLEELRKMFFEGYHILPGAFDIYRDGSFACRIIFERTAPAKERYRIKFRNSLGVFDIIEIIGHATVAPDEGDDESSTINKYDMVTDGFTQHHERTESTTSITIDSTFSRPHEVALLRDMLKSDEVYLIDLPGSPMAVIPSVENMSCELRMTSPVKFTLSLRAVDPDAFVSDDISDSSDHRRKRIFQKEFSKQFN